MDLIVMKFGGTSVADAERVKRAARRIVDKRELGNGVVAVLSARGKTTDELIAMAEEISDAPDPREMDMLLSSGERISCALCAMAINDLGHRAISLTGSQAGIVTDESHTKARILDVRGERIHCRSSFEDAPGTVVMAEEETMEQPLITAVTHSIAEARLTLVGVPNEPGAAARIFEALAEVSVNVDMIVQNEPASAEGLA